MFTFFIFISGKYKHINIFFGNELSGANGQCRSMRNITSFKQWDRVTAFFFFVIVV